MNPRLAIVLALVAPIALAQTRIPRRAPAPPDNPITEEKIALGRQLFFDPRLSLDGTVSCHTCHRVIAGAWAIDGADGLPTSIGVHGRRGTRNAPTVLNSGLRSALFWDGRATSLEEQAVGPLVNPVEMAMPDLATVVTVVDGIPGYRAAFAEAFAAERAPGQRLTIDEVAKAIATYERTLMTPDSPFDRFLAGDETALSPRARGGWELFRSLGCLGCHGTTTFSGDDFFLRMPANPVDDFEYLLGFSKDRGRANVTGRGKDVNFWRVPSLRNVALTAPYFHNGLVPTLEQAVRIMARVQLRRVLEEEEVKDLVAFLNSLTGQLPEQTQPELPGFTMWTAAAPTAP
jgi:cytochrome c peroxidase